MLNESAPGRPSPLQSAGSVVAGRSKIHCGTSMTAWLNERLGVLNRLLFPCARVVGELEILCTINIRLRARGCRFRTNKFADTYGF